MEVDWDLQAVVRSCGGRAAAASGEAARDPFSSFPPSLLLGEGGWVASGGGGDDDDFLFCFPNLLSSLSAMGELEELCKPFFSKSQPQAQQQQKQAVLPVSPLRSPSSGISVLPQPPSSSAGPLPLQQPQKPQQQPRPVSLTSRSKRRKNQQKRVVCHVPANGLSSDMWAWRKYGQKPIKGSPYPRGYYRCSSSKGCPARKLVERSRTDPGMFVITYTAEHNHPLPTHRNSLAGSTRHKFPSTTQQSPTAVFEAAAAHKACSSSPLSFLTAASAEDELAAPKKEEEGWDEQEEGMLMVSDMELLGDEDMLFLDLDELQNASPSHSPPADAFNGSFPAVGFSSPWMASTAAAGGS